MSSRARILIMYRRLQILYMHVNFASYGGREGPFRTRTVAHVSKMDISKIDNSEIGISKIDISKVGRLFKHARNARQVHDQENHWTSAITQKHSYTSRRRQLALFHLQMFRESTVE